MKYEITIRQLEPFTEEELEKQKRYSTYDTISMRNNNIFSNKPFHEVRVLQAEVSKEEFEAVKKAIVGIM